MVWCSPPVNSSSPKLFPSPLYVFFSLFKYLISLWASIHYIHPLTSWCSCVRRWWPHIRPLWDFQSFQPRRSAGSVPDPTSRTATFRESPVINSRDQIKHAAFKLHRKLNGTVALERQETQNNCTRSSNLIVKIHPALNTEVNSSWEPLWKKHEPLLPSGS